MKNSLGMLLLILLVGCEKTIERVVVENKPGLSAYELAVNNGFLGTEQQWLASLVGAPGAPGQDGLDAAQITPILLCATSNEYALKINGALYAVYVNRVNQLTYLAKLAVGNYITTDGTSCTFSVNADGTTTTTGIGTLPGGPTPPPAPQHNLVFDSEVGRNNGIHNNAEIEIKLKNVGTATLQRFKVTISGLDTSKIRSGSSLTGPYGNIISFTDNSVTALVTSSPAIEPNGFVKVKILLDKLNASQNLTYTVEVL